MLTYLQVRGSDGALRLQRLDRMPAVAQSEMVHGDVERVHQVDKDGATVEDAKTGKVRRNGKPKDGPGPLAELRARIPKPKTPKGAKAGGQ